MSTRVWDNTPRHTINIDWDGTAVPSMWPEHPTEFMPGFVHNMQRLHAAGHALRIYTARLNPWDPYTGERRHPADVKTELGHIRDLLDRHGLTYVDIFTKDGKPSGSAYIDDKAERYSGRPGSWDRVTDKVLMRLGAERPMFRAFPEEK